MLDELKRAMRAHEQDGVADIMLEATRSSSIKDKFLDDPETVMMGAEDDPEIKSLVGTLPGYDDGNEGNELEVDIEALAESMVETDI